MNGALTASAVFALVASYLLGAIPFGLIAGKLRGVDIRATGSGNIGATNVWRTLGPQMGAAVFALDVLNGFAAPTLALALVGHEAHVLAAACAALAILGHTFSFWLRFRGGKGIATGFGAMLGLVPVVAIACLVAWGAALALSRMISVASIVACIAAPIGLYLTHAERPYVYVVSALVVVAIMKHLPNVRRILNGTEPKIGAKSTVGIDRTVGDSAHPVSGR
jgi:glycerol-3-phosphate acyltransferase PlsY